MWLGSWHDLARVALVGPLAYVAVVLVLRASGNRTLSKLHAFDLVVTAAIGSTLGTVLLVALQRVVAWGRAWAVVLEADGSRSVMGPTTAARSARSRT
jgi:uncharacterized membrane protein YcaP (DUF421 family)